MAIGGCGKLKIAAVISDFLLSNVTASLPTCEA
jgi:hypothetical protein